VRDKARFLMPGVATAAAVVVVLAVGPSSAHVSAAAGHLRAASHPVPRSAVAGSAASLISRGPVPELDASRSGKFSVPVAPVASSAPKVAPVGKLRTVDEIVVARGSLPAGALAAVQRLPDVAAAQLVAGARVRVDGKFAAVLGVDASQFRSFAARPTASSNALWQGVADGSIAVSYTMGRLDRLPLGGDVSVNGVRVRRLRVGGFGTVGIPGVDAVVSEWTARALGFPVGNVIVVSAPHANLATLTSRIARVMPRDAVIQPLVSQAQPSGAAGVIQLSANSYDGYPTLTSSELVTMLMAARSRLGRPYVWGGDGPYVFDCSGLVQWSFAQAGLVMPRVAADQALTGPEVPLSRAEPGDLLFYHTDPTDPTYISHVAIYLGDGLMIQSPEPGLDVEIVPVALGPEFAGAVRVDPRLAAEVAASVGD
jgi:peptidoglycan DL-endopeptidase CwlO